jgi:hypothetical protein
LSAASVWSVGAGGGSSDGAVGGGFVDGGGSTNPS